MLIDFFFIALESKLYSFGRKMPRDYLYLFMREMSCEILYLKIVCDQGPERRVKLSLGLI